MKKSSHAYVRFLNVYRALNQEGATTECKRSIHHDAVAVLAFISAQNELGIPITFTHIVQKIEFGTPPTIQRRLKELLDCQFVAFSQGADKRQRLLKSTAEGERYLAECSQMMSEALGST